jgi:lipopolysaccharide transport system ATP-binding protein
MSETAIHVENLGKRFRMNHKRAGTFKEHLHNRLNRVNGEKTEYVNALDGLTFSVAKGEVLGIIGPNGSGKSTLLRILSGITAPTAGRVEINGRVASVLDLGTGFHPDLSGLENIYLSGSLMGMKRSEIKQKTEEIIAFSELEKFIHTPVKHFSSGMYIRLAFSVMAHLDADILLLDEVLSVGDAAFQVKSYKKMQELLNAGNTILLVSHNLTSLSRYTTRCLYLENGKLAGEGRTDEIINTYAESTFTNQPAKINGGKPNPENLRVWKNPDTAPGNEIVRLRRIAVHNENRSTDEPIYVDEKIVIEIEFEKLDNTEPINIALRVNDVNGNPLFYVSPFLEKYKDEWKDSLLTKGKKSIKCLIQRSIFNNSIYGLDLLLLTTDNIIIFTLPYVITFKLYSKNKTLNRALYSLSNVPFSPEVRWLKY